MLMCTAGCVYSLCVCVFGRVCVLKVYIVFKLFT